MRRHSTIWVAAWRVVAGAAVAAAGVIGVVLHEPWLFPSLGPTVVLMLESPADPSARVVNAIVGHLVAVVVGLGCLLVAGLQGQPSAPVAGLTTRDVVAGVLSVCLTMTVLTLVGRPHPPAGATTLLVSLGILTTPGQLLSVVAAAVFVALLARGSGLITARRGVAPGVVVSGALTSFVVSPRYTRGRRPHAEPAS